MGIQTLARPFLPAVRLAAVFTLAAVPCVCAPLLKGSIKLSAEAKIEAVTSGDKNPKLHWVLLSRPSEAGVNANPIARALVVQAIADIYDQRGSCIQFVVEERTNCSFSDLLKDKLRSISFRPLNMTKPPAMAGQLPDAELRFEYTSPPPPPPTFISMLSVTVTTDFFDQSQSKTPPPGSSLQVAWEKAAARLGKQAPPPNGAAILILIQYTEADRRRSIGGKFTASVVEDALLSVGIAALEKARDANCLPGSPAPSTMTMESVQNSLQHQFQLPIPGWPVPSVGFRVDPASNDYSILVSRLRIASDAKVDIVRGQIAGKSGMVDFVGANPRLEREIQNILTKAASHASEDIKSQLDAIRGHVPTIDAITAARRALNSEPLITGNVDVRRMFSQIIFVGTRRWSVGSLNGQAKLTGAITPEDFVTGQASLDASNLIRNILPVTLGETYSLAIQGGSEVQRATLDFSIPRSHGTTWVTNYGFTHSLLFSRDAKQRFGDDNPHDTPLIYRQMGMTPQLFFELSRAPGEAWVFSARAQVSYDWRAVLIAPRTAGAANLVDGQLSAPTADFRLLVGHDSTAGSIGSVRAGIHGTALRGTRALKGDFAFQQFTMSTRAEIFFGPKERNSDYFLRYERGLGVSSTRTPLFELMRLGGATSVRGLENGEFVGRNMAYDQSAAGISALTIAGLFHKTATGADSPKIGGFDLANVYVVGLYDRGRVTNAGSLGNLLSVGPAMHSYGIAGELRKLPAIGKQLANITIGWARSPQSGIHPHGLLTLGVDVDF